LGTEIRIWEFALGCWEGLGVQNRMQTPPQTVRSQTTAKMKPTYEGHGVVKNWRIGDFTSSIDTRSSAIARWSLIGRFRQQWRLARAALSSGVLSVNRTRVTYTSAKEYHVPLGKYHRADLPRIASTSGEEGTTEVALVRSTSSGKMVSGISDALTSLPPRISVSRRTVARAGRNSRRRSVGRMWVGHVVL
jgi:hypothetical protein